MPRAAGLGARSPLCPRPQWDPSLRAPAPSPGVLTPRGQRPVGRMCPGRWGRARTLPASTPLPMNKSRGIQQPSAALHWEQPRCLVGASAAPALPGAIPSSGSNAATPASPPPEEGAKGAPTSSQPPDGRTDGHVLPRSSDPQWGFPRRGGDPRRSDPFSLPGRNRSQAKAPDPAEVQLPGHIWSWVILPSQEQDGVLFQFKRRNVILANGSS